MTLQCNLNYLHQEKDKEDEEAFDDLIKYDSDLEASTWELKKNIKIIEQEQQDKHDELAAIKNDIQELKYFQKTREEVKVTEPDQEAAPVKEQSQNKRKVNKIELEEEKV